MKMTFMSFIFSKKKVVQTWIFSFKKTETSTVFRILLSKTEHMKCAEIFKTMKLKFVECNPTFIIFQRNVLIHRLIETCMVLFTYGIQLQDRKIWYCLWNFVDKNCFLDLLSSGLPAVEEQSSNCKQFGLV